MPRTEFRVVGYRFSFLLMVSNGTIDIMTMWNSVPLIRMINKMRALAKEASQKESQSV